MNRELYLKTVSRNLLANIHERVLSVSVFNFETGTNKYNLDDEPKDKIFSQDVSWIRVFINGGVSYDFITDSLLIFNLNNSLIMMCGDDAVFMDEKYITGLVKDHLLKNTDIVTASSEEKMKEYYRHLKVEVDETSKELERIHSEISNSDTSRLNIADSFEFANARLLRINITNALIKQLISENEDEILSKI